MRQEGSYWPFVGIACRPGPDACSETKWKLLATGLCGGSCLEFRTVISPFYYTWCNTTWPVIILRSPRDKCVVTKSLSLNLFCSSGIHKWGGFTSEKLYTFTASNYKPVTTGERHSMGLSVAHTKWRVLLINCSHPLFPLLNQPHGLLKLGYCRQRAKPQSILLNFVCLQLQKMTSTIFFKQ